MPQLIAPTPTTPGLDRSSGRRDPAAGAAPVLVPPLAAVVVSTLTDRAMVYPEATSPVIVASSVAPESPKTPSVARPTLARFGTDAS